MTPTPRQTYRAARVLELDALRRDRLDVLADRARVTLYAALCSAAASVTGSHEAPWPSLSIPGYRIELTPDDRLAVHPTADPVPHDWTQTSMDDYLEPDA